MGNNLACKYGNTNSDLHEKHLYEMGLSGNEVAEEHNEEQSRFAEENKRMHFKSLGFQRVHGESYSTKEESKKKSRASTFQSTVSPSKTNGKLSRQISIMLADRHKITPKKTKDIYGINRNPNYKKLTYTIVKEAECKKKYLRTRDYPEPGEVLLEGNLMKYHPGFDLLYVERNCVVTYEYFLYYSNKSSYLKMPIVKLWRGDMESISKVKVSSFKRCKDANYQFEIIMKPNWKLGKFYYQEIGIDNLGQKNYDNRSVSVGRIAKPVPAHLMLQPPLLDRYKNDSIISRKGSVESEELIYVDRIRFRDAQEAKAYKAFALKNKDTVTLISRAEEIGVKNPKRWISGLGGMHTWSNRELEWYLAEERMLFATKTEIECDRWVILLNWLLQTQ